MKKNLFLSAAALAGAMTMVSCSSEEEMKPQNGKREEVKTSFTLSVGSVKHGTRMIADAVQVPSEFKGMTGIQLFPFIGSPDANSPIAITPIRLADFTTFDKTAVNAKIYSNITIPVGVNNFVFYGMIPDNSKGNGELRASYERNSLTTTSTLGNDIYFNLVSWNEDLTLDGINSNDNAIRILNALNDINSVLTTEIANANQAAETTQETALKACQSAWIAMRAGSSASVLALAEKLYNHIKGMGDNNTYANAVSAEILDHFTELSGDINKGYKLSWKTTTNFPTTDDITLPDGAVSVQYDDNNKQFSYVANSVDGMEMTDVAKYMHPARLSYFVKTQAMTKTVPYLTENNPTTWSDLYNKYENSPVNLATQSVILKDQIQYAVGRLDVQVKIADVSLYDSGSGDPNSADKDPQLVIAPNGGYPLSAVLIGGQKQVNWDFTTNNSSNVTYTIYDNIMTSNNIVAKKGDYSTVNHTLALETKENETIKVCLELTNTGNDFYGHENQIIPSGSKFYLIADLKPGTNEKGNPDSKIQVFLQDYTTTAKLTIGANSLKNAYNVIPDLRSPKLELGLSVDLEWKTGITFEQEF